MRWPCRRSALLMISLAVSGCSAATLDSFLYSPKKAPPDGYHLSTAVIPGHVDLHIVTSDGVTLHAAYVPGTSRPDVTLIYFHGQNTNVGTAWPRLEYLYPLGYNLLVLDYRGFGLSTGEPSEAGLRIDIRAVREAAIAQSAVRPDHLVYYGRSLGGAPAIDLAETDPPAALITESTFASVQALIDDGSGFDLPRGFLASSAWDSLAKIPHVTAPYLALHGTADTYVQPKYSVELTAAHPGPTQLFLVPHATHGDDPSLPSVMGLPTYVDTLANFIQSHLP